jgi:hypothetical protein
MLQADLFGGDVETARQFWEFHEENPHVYDEIVRLCRQANARGFKHWSINGIFEVIRWNRAIKTRADDYKLNNNLKTPYARYVMQNEPDLRGFFITRQSRRYDPAFTDGNDDE